MVMDSDDEQSDSSDTSISEYESYHTKSNSK